MTKQSMDESKQDPQQPPCNFQSKVDSCHTEDHCKCYHGRIVLLSVSIGIIQVFRVKVNSFILYIS
nr:MAG TPA: hypothetical protein [Caudoviricetes sp.]